ncbi:HD-GYP domain-containing protein [Paenibacillus sp. GYB003]|uniref:HD-GYP domain-containing protein n=1 Tax=Paenibacillus sp. GYB003 TaxID=2994392 RepID=UPI002F9688F5
MQCAEYNDLVGKRLLHNITNASGMLLIPEETILTQAHIEKLEKFNVDLYDIHVETVQEPIQDSESESGVQEEPERRQAQEKPPGRFASPEPVRADTGLLAKRADAKLREIEKSILENGIVPLADIEENVLPAVLEAAQNRNVYKLFADLKAEGDFRFKHSIGVACMSAVLGRWLGMDERETALLATAASLCDIGTIKLPSAILHKTSELLPHELDIMKQHTVLGYDMLKESGLEGRAALVALQHHEREDGSGYPYGLKGKDIDTFGKIVALCDSYLAMSSDRPQRPALPFYRVIRQLHDDIVAGRFDSAIGMTFLNRLMAAQVGGDVGLSDGRRGKIVLIHPNYPTRPLIAIDGQTFVDLSKTESLHITEVFG